MTKFYTTYEEAQELKKLGLKPETASMIYFRGEINPVSVETTSEYTPSLVSYNEIKENNNPYKNAMLTLIEPCWTITDLLYMAKKYNMVKPNENSDLVSILGRTEHEYGDSDNPFDAVFDFFKYMLAELSIDEEYTTYQEN